MKYYFEYNGERVVYEVIRSNRKSIAVEVKLDGQILLRIPNKVTKELWTKILDSKVDWIMEKRKELQKKQFRKREYSQGDVLLFRGKEYILRCNRETIRKTQIKVVENHIEIDYPMSKEISITEEIRKWYYEQAKIYFTEKVREYADKMGVCYQRIAIKDQKTRWGSCSSKGNLNFNFRLIMAPEEIIDYVIIHELAHLSHMDHSIDFWSVVEKYDGNYREHTKWLRIHGNILTSML